MRREKFAKDALDRGCELQQNVPLMLSCCGGKLHGTPTCEAKPAEANTRSSDANLHPRLEMSTDAIATITSEASGSDHFLRRWFHVLTNRLLLSDRHASDPHTVRVEASSPSDWWIQVLPPSYERCHSCGHYATHEAPSRTAQEGKLRELREALMLVTAYARLEYESWLHEIKETSRLRFCHQDFLCSRFSIVVGGETAADGSYPCELLANAFWGADHQYSDEFKESYEQLMARAERLLIPLPSLHVPIPIRFEFSQLSTSLKKDADELSTLADIVTRIRQLRNEDSTFPSFFLDCVELRLRRHELNPLTMVGIDRIVDTGIKIRLLELPGRLEEPVNWADLHRAWRSLAQKLFRSADQITSPAAPQIERLELPAVYSTTDLAAAWLPPLTKASNVRSLTIHDGISSNDPLQPSALSLAWVYLGYAMFSADSNNSIESLHLSGLGGIGTETVALMASVAVSQTPLVELWRVMENHRRETLGNASGQEDKTNFLSTRPQNSRTPSARLHRLVLSASTTEAADRDSNKALSIVKQVLQCAGSRLTDLAIEGTQIDDAALSECLGLCPSLQNFRLNGANLQSLNSLLRRPHNTRVPNLSALDLQCIQTSQESLHAFIETVKASDSALECLHIGKGWSGRMNESTFRMIDEMLNTNQTLSYLQVFRPHDPFSETPSTAWEQLKIHNGKLISSRERPLAFESKIAVLDSTQKSVQNTQSTPLNQDVLTLVFQFAATPRQRTVIIESDRTSYLY